MVSNDEIEKYKKMVTDASVEELKKYDVILCTCTVSASPRIERLVIYFILFSIYYQLSQ